MRFRFEHFDLTEQQERFQREVYAAIEHQLAAEAEVMEEMLVQAVMLQDYDMLDRLHIVDQEGHHRAVGSALA